jgi:hypothetical protein
MGAGWSGIAILRRKASPWGSTPVPSMGDNQPEANTPSPDKEEAEELRRILQSDDIPPVDYASFGRRAAQIIQRAVIGYWRKH